MRAFVVFRLNEPIRRVTARLFPQFGPQRPTVKSFLYRSDSHAARLRSQGQSKMLPLPGVVEDANETERAADDIGSRSLVQTVPFEPAALLSTQLQGLLHRDTVDERSRDAWPEHVNLETSRLSQFTYG